tara:strand:- start:232 stop:363 length:132 start_codon:yes stop_codon:yes gene_type:complete
VEISLFIKISLLVVALIATYAVVRNFDVIKLIFNYWKDLLFRK